MDGWMDDVLLLFKWETTSEAIGMPGNATFSPWDYICTFRGESPVLAYGVRLSEEEEEEALRTLEDGE